jgi:potassium-transporting ATPase KdpC subunit
VLAIMRSALMIFVLLTALTGVIYPLVVTAIAQIVFPHQANGSLIPAADKPIGSELIGQYFDEPRYFWGRPSATTPPNDVLASSGSNLGPTNPDLVKAVKERLETLRKAHPDQTGPVPVDLVTTSASGIDPHISAAAAEYQVTRVAKTRGLDPASVRKFVSQHTEGRTIGILGEPRVNVLRLNLALDGKGYQ